ncbi:alpha-amylase family glycosyl hydrolase [Corynebacterium pilosum]|uniref:Putative cyclomaltodextrinase or neopullalanase n=1 Tax=Corynebacterium pilosum TaxID=35756 RepID=A0A376CPE6_9CORY|nr:alpha-amylase family glycosyl hydrolase [Corynebacterium pilosum]STC70087.1 putative cyclomaltodextrinase or neopullalanase [Corynebacterium pilosum]
MNNLANQLWWHIYPLGALGAPIRQRPTDGSDHGHRILRLINWLDYAAELGATGLLLGPVFESTAHGYDTLDHFSIDSRLGTEDDMIALIDEARARDIDVIFDGVFNHVCINHAFVHHGGPVRRNADGTLAGWEGDGTLAELDHEDPRCVDFVVDVMNYWLDRGIAGWRLDVAYDVPTWFWAEVTDRVRQRHPNAYFSGEMIHGDYADFARESHLDTMTQYEVWHAVWASIQANNLWELEHSLWRHQDFSARNLMQTFVGNHDVSRVASMVGDSGAALAAVILLTLPGLPSIYYGDEQAFRGEKGEGWEADDALRPELPEHPDQLFSFGHWMFKLYRDLVAFRKANPWIATGELAIEEFQETALAYSVRGDGHELMVHVRVDEGRTHASVLLDSALVLDRSFYDSEAAEQEAV